MISKQAGKHQSTRPKSKAQSRSVVEKIDKEWSGPAETATTCLCASHVTTSDLPLRFAKLGRGGRAHAEHMRNLNTQELIPGGMKGLWQRLT